ncbi:hypothetical protein H6P81_018076 [Aristolochia fimbriata]|uniref:CCHC-type domain-containing protein n=1 Tax=Aristolochia fimbriata TaxID=158543 RepID=A0AAV7E0D0_ARIFI|nr:hypothetical protein H6P81_018076 [Aristolochia fimbriata]
MTDHCSQYVSTLEQHWQLNTGAVIKSVFPPKEALTIQGVKGASMAIVHPVETTSTPSTTELLQAINQLVKQGNFANLTLEAVGKLLQQMEGKINQLLAQKAVKPPCSEASTSKQVIKSPLIHPPMKLEMLHEGRTGDLLEKFLEEIGSRQINTLPETQTYQQTLPSSSQAVHVKQEHSRVSPSRPQPFDLNTEENPLVYANSYDAKVINEWNIDNPAPKKVQDTIHRMLIYSNVCRSRGMTEPIVVNQIVAGLSGDLYGWWYNYLDEPYRNHILYAVKIDASGAPLLDSEDKPISDAVMSLLVSIVSNFSWDPSRQTETTKYLLHNIRCRTLTDLNWFIEGLPTQFATKVKEGLRQNPNEEVNWNALHYGHLQAACTQQGLALCNDLRLKKQLKQDHISAKTLGEFCKQFAFDPVQMNHCGTSYCKRPTKPFSQGGRKRRLPFSKSRRPKEKLAETPSKRALTAKPRASGSKPSCYKCGRQGHFARDCFARQKQKVKEVAIDDQSKALVLQLLEEEEHYSFRSHNEDSDQLEQLEAMFRMTTSLNMLSTDDLSELFSRLTDQKDKQLLLETVLREPKTESSKYCDNHYTMPALYKRLLKQTASSTPPDLQKKIKVCKQEIQELKAAYYQLSSRIEALEQPASPTLHASPKGESSHQELQPEIIPVQKATEQYLHQMLQSIIQKKWYVLISVFIQGKPVLRNVVALVRQWCRPKLHSLEGVLPIHFLQPSTETLNSACGNALTIKGKVGELLDAQQK